MSKKVINGSNENEVIKRGKIPENITAEDNKQVTKSFKLSPEEDKQFRSAVQSSGFTNISEYIRYKLFDNTPIFVIDSGHELLKELSDCAELLADMNVNHASLEQYDALRTQFNTIEEKIAFLFNSVDAIKERLIDEREGEKWQS